MFGKEGVHASSAGGGGAAASPGGQGWAGRGPQGSGGFPPGFFSGSPGGSGGATFFSFSDGTGSRSGFDPFADPEDLFEGLFGGSGGSSRNRGTFGDGVSGLFDTFFGSPSFGGPRGMQGAGRRSRTGADRSSRGRNTAPGSPAEGEFWCSLKELYEGCEKALKVTDTIRDPRTREMRQVSHVYKITVKPGWKDGTRVTFPATPEGLRSICFVLRQKPHPFLRREGDCLVYDCQLTQDQARRGVKISVPLLSKDDAPVEVVTKGQKVFDGKEVLIPGLGMPRKGGAPGERGSFKVKFRVVQSGKAPAA